MSRIVEIRDLSARIERLAAQVESLRVHPVYTEHGCYVRAELRDAAEKFLARAALKRGKR